MSVLDKVDSKTKKAIEDVQKFCKKTSQHGGCLNCPFMTKVAELNGYYKYSCRLRDEPKNWDFEKVIRPISYDFLLAGIRNG